MEKKRKAPGASQPAASMRPAAAAGDAKKAASTTTTQPTLAKPSVAPIPARTSALTTRTTGPTISKPPTRPVLGPSKKSVTSGSENGAEKIENIKPSRMSTIGTASSRMGRPDSAQDKSRRTTMGVMPASGSVKRPAVPSRLSSASPTKFRMAAVPAHQPAIEEILKSPRKPPRKLSSAAGGRPLSTTTTTIQEESEALDRVPQMVSPKKNSGMTARPMSPTKLEIRPIASVPSDTETTKPKPISRHSRAQSAQQIIVRPSTAPGPSPSDIMSEHESHRRDMAIMQNLLRESTMRDTLEEELKDLRSENARLEKRMLKLAEAAKAQNGNALAAVDVSAKEKANTDKLEALRQTHKTALSALEATHTKELSRLRTELAKQQQSSSKFTLVETKIAAVEQALNESRQRASLNEQELHQTIREKEYDHDQLARVIEDLKTEIDRCQAKLNKDVAKQAKEKKEALKVVEELRRELAEEKTRGKETGEREREEELKEAKEVGRAEMEAKLRSASAKHQQELESARTQHKQQLATSQNAVQDSASTVQTLQAQLGKLRDEHQQNLSSAQTQHNKQLKLGESARESSAGAAQGKLKALNAEFSQKLQEVEAQKQRAEESESRAEDLRTAYTVLQSQLASVQTATKEELASVQAETKKEGARANDAEKKIKSLQQEVSQAKTLSGNLRAQLVVAEKEQQRVRKECESEVEGLKAEVGKLESEWEGLRREREQGEEERAKSRLRYDELGAEKEAIELMVKKLQFEQSELRKKANKQEKESARLQKALAGKDKDLQARDTLVLELQNEMTALQQKLDNAAQSKDEKVVELQSKIDGLRKEVDGAGQSESEEVAKLNSTIEALTQETTLLQQKLDDAAQNRDEEVSKLNERVESLTQQTTLLQRKLESAVQSRDEEVTNLNNTLETLTQETTLLKQRGEDQKTAKDEEILALQQKLSSAIQSQNGEVAQLNTTIEALRQETSALKLSEEEHLTTKETETQAHNGTIEKLHGEVGDLRKELESALKSREEEVTKRDETIETLRQETSAIQQRTEEQKTANEQEMVALQAGLEDAAQSKTEEVAKLNETIEALRQETSVLQLRAEEHTTAKETENNEMSGVIAALHVQIRDLEHETEEADTNHDEAIESLQSQVQAVKQSLADEEAGRQYAEGQLQSVNEAHERLAKQVDTLREARDAAGTDAGQKDARIEELVAELGEAEADKSSAEASLGTSTEELRGLQKVLDSFERDVGEKEAVHADGLEKLREEHGREMEELRGELAESREQQQDSLELSGEEHKNSLDRVTEDFEEQKKGLQDELNELRGQHEAMKTLHRGSEEQVASHRQEEHDDGLQSELRERCDVLELEKGELERELAALRESHVQKTDSHQEDFQKDDDSDEELSELREQCRVLEQQKLELESELEEVQVSPGEEVQALQQQTSPEANQPDVELERKYADVLQEKRALDKVLEDMETQQERKVQQLVGKHDLAYRKLQQELEDERAKESVDSGENEEVLEEVREECEERVRQLTEQHDTAYQELKQIMEFEKEEQAAEVLRQAAELQEKLDIAMDLHKRQEALSGEHERSVQTVTDKHTAQVAELEAASVERDRAHKAALAALEAKLREAKTGTTLEPEPRTPSRNLSHIFVGQTNGGDEMSRTLAKPLFPVPPHHEEAERDDMTVSAETPLAYASESEPHYSPTPAYPKGGRRAGAVVAVFQQQPEYVQLHKENAGLVAALQEARAELMALKSTTTQTSLSERQQQRSPQRRPSALPRPVRPQTPQQRYSNNEDPFATPNTNGHSHAHPGSPRPSWNNGKMTLEGTLESIRVQTEQLLEINDDFIAEQQRWSRKLSTTRSQRNSPMRAGNF